jgi:hypothetical protein
VDLSGVLQVVRRGRPPAPRPTAPSGMPPMDNVNGIDSFELLGACR